MSARAQKIARMAGKTTYRDFREGFSDARLVNDSDADIKHALGMAQQSTSALAVQVLETHYASTLQHERVIRRAWERRLTEIAKKLEVKRDHRTIATQRMAASLAIRQLAGARMIQFDIAEYAWMVNSNRESIKDAMGRCTGWLEELRNEAESAFLVALDVIRPRRGRVQLRSRAA